MQFAAGHIPLVLATENPAGMPPVGSEARPPHCPNTDTAKPAPLRPQPSPKTYSSTALPPKSVKIEQQTTNYPSSPAVSADLCLIADEPRSTTLPSKPHPRESQASQPTDAIGSHCKSCHSEGPPGRISCNHYNPDDKHPAPVPSKS